MATFLGVMTCLGDESATDQTFNFVVTNRFGQNILLIGPEKKDIRIGVLGKTFTPANTSAAERVRWPVGKWTTTTCPPYDPTRVQWEYMLVLTDDGKVTFEEQEHTIEYAADLRTVVRDWKLSRVLLLIGTWESTGDKQGKIHFTKRKEGKPN